MPGVLPSPMTPEKSDDSGDTPPRGGGPRSEATTPHPKQDTKTKPALSKRAGSYGKGTEDE